VFIQGRDAAKWIPRQAMNPYGETQRIDISIARIGEVDLCKRLQPYDLASGGAGFCISFLADLASLFFAVHARRGGAGGQVSSGSSALRE